MRPRKAEREKRDETKPMTAFYFSSLKNKKQTLFRWECSSAEGLLGLEIRKSRREEVIILYLSLYMKIEGINLNRI